MNLEDDATDPVRYWVAFSLVEGIGPIRLRRLWEYFESLEDAWGASATDLCAAGLDARLAATLARGARPLAPADAVVERARRGGMTLLTMAHPGYPQRLLTMDDAPPILYIRGTLAPDDALCLAVVGTRMMSSYGREVTHRFVTDLARARLTVVSGLARGVDTCAHRAALEAGGRTIAVLGSGLDIIYPSENAALARAIVERGALISEFPPGTKPDAPNFPRRNRIVAGMTMGTLVTEAGEGSGALLTGKLALDYNREVFAVPGPIYARGSEGVNAVIRRGEAKLVSKAEHILEELQLDGAPEQLAFRIEQPDDPVERQLLALLTPEPQHIDLLTRQSALPSHVVSSALTMLELKGAARQVGGLQYVRGH